MAIFNENGILLAAGSNATNNFSTLESGEIDKIIEQTYAEIIGAGLAVDTIMEAVDIKAASAAVWGAIKKALVAVGNAFEAVANFFVKQISKLTMTKDKEARIRANWSKLTISGLPFGGAEYKNTLLNSKYHLKVIAAMQKYKNEPIGLISDFNNAVSTIENVNSSNASSCKNKIDSLLVGSPYTGDEYKELIANKLMPRGDKISKEDASGTDFKSLLKSININNLIKYAKDIEINVKVIRESVKKVKKLSGSIESKIADAVVVSDLNDKSDDGKEDPIKAVKAACTVTCTYGNTLIKSIKQNMMAAIALCNILGRKNVTQTEGNNDNTSEE